MISCCMTRKFDNQYFNPGSWGNVELRRPRAITIGISIFQANVDDAPENDTSALQVAQEQTTKVHIFRDEH